MNAIRSPAAALFSASLCMPLLAQPQPFPAKPITIVVPFTAGGGTDAVIRGLSPAGSRYHRAHAAGVRRRGCHPPGAHHPVRQAAVRRPARRRAGRLAPRPEPAGHRAGATHYDILATTAMSSLVAGEAAGR